MAELDISSKVINQMKLYRCQYSVHSLLYPQSHHLPVLPVPQPRLSANLGDLPRSQTANKPSILSGKEITVLIRREMYFIIKDKPSSWIKTFFLSIVCLETDTGDTIFRRQKWLVLIMTFQINYMFYSQIRHQNGKVYIISVQFFDLACECKLQRTKSK